MGSRAGAIGNLPWQRGTSQPGVKMTPRGAQHKEAITAELQIQMQKLGINKFIETYGSSAAVGILGYEANKFIPEEPVYNDTEGNEGGEIVPDRVTEEPPIIPPPEDEGPDIASELITEAVLRQTQKALEEQNLQAGKETTIPVEEVELEKDLKKIVQNEEQVAKLKEQQKEVRDKALTNFSNPYKFVHENSLLANPLEVSDFEKEFFVGKMAEITGAGQESGVIYKIIPLTEQNRLLYAKSIADNTEPLIKEKHTHLRLVYNTEDGNTLVIPGTIDEIIRSFNEPNTAGYFYKTDSLEDSNLEKWIHLDDEDFYISRD